MKTYLDCYPCFLRQALEATRQTGADEKQHRVVLNRVLDALNGIRPSRTPPEIGDLIHASCARKAVMPTHTRKRKRQPPATLWLYIPV